jgi:diguanylate cyclase (GGDEF)-like protein/PAS domain S-box-containing protein
MADGRSAAQGGRAQRWIPRGRALPAHAWERGHRMLLALLVLHVAALPILALALAGASPLRALAQGAPLAVLALGGRLGGGRRLRASAVTLGLLTASALLVQTLGGALEAHLHFAVVVALLTLYLDWPPLALAVGYVVLHHGLLAETVPSELLARSGDAWSSALIHVAAIAVAAAANVVTWRMSEELRDQARISTLSFERAFDEAPIGMVLVSAGPDAAGRILRVNRAFERMLGRPADEIVELGWQALTHPGDVGESDGLARALVAGEIDVAEVEKRYVHANGREVWARLRAALVRDDEGTPLYWISQVEDVTAERRSEAAMATQHVVSELLGRAAGLADVMPEVLILLSVRLGWRRAVLWRVDARAEELRAAGSWPEDASPGEVRRRGEGLAGETWERGEPRPGAIPLRAGDDVLAILEFEHADGPDRDPDDDELLAALARQLGLFLDRLRRAEQVLGLQRDATTDPLTGLPNRRAWEEALPRELARAARDRSPLCLAVIDLDHFKDFNDAHGHPAGDALLRDCAASWNEVVRRSDLLARYGGEEFVLVLPDCDTPAGAELLERLRAATPTGCTCSAGLARWSPGEGPHELVRRADEALYAAKRAGRDRVVTAVSDATAS